MNRCRLLFLVVQFLCTSILAAPLQPNTNFGDIYHPEAFEANIKAEIEPALQIELLTIPFRDHQLSADELFPETMIPLNNDLRRARLNLHDRVIQPSVQRFIISPTIVDATRFRISASYHFSSTDFHCYLFRLKPF